MIELTLWLHLVHAGLDMIGSVCFCLFMGYMALTSMGYRDAQKRIVKEGDELIKREKLRMSREGKEPWQE